MIKICKKTKKQQHYVEQFYRTKTYSLYDAYKKPSEEKIYYYDRCLDIEVECGGMYGRIISHSKRCFIYAFKYWREVYGGKGVKEILKVITPTQIIDIDLQIEYFN